MRGVQSLRCRTHRRGASIAAALLTGACLQPHAVSDMASPGVDFCPTPLCVSRSMMLEGTVECRTDGGSDFGMTRVCLVSGPRPQDSSNASSINRGARLTTPFQSGRGAGQFEQAR